MDIASIIAKRNHQFNQNIIQVLQIGRILSENANQTGMHISEHLFPVIYSSDCLKQFLHNHLLFTVREIRLAQIEVFHLVEEVEHIVAAVGRNYHLYYSRISRDHSQILNHNEIRLNVFGNAKRLLQLYDFRESLVLVVLLHKFIELFSLAIHSQSIYLS